MVVNGSNALRKVPSHQFGMHKARFRVVHIFPVLRAFDKFVVNILSAQFFGHLRDAPVVISIFQGG